ncbi:hypothetical protein ACFRJ7_30815 [Streptomyces sp. NPDC056747]|uniref:hypothetical protein n=1 Tax=Streptomyces sp. NPDC056747 TaxID=3345935 RepID=UPI00367E1354
MADPRRDGVRRPDRRRGDRQPRRHRGQGRKPTPTPTAKPGPATSFEGDGQYLVGEDIAAGTHKTAGAADSAIPNCYWARHKDASGEFSSIIANGNVQGQTRVTVRKGEYPEVNGCLPWKKAG